MRTVSPRSAKNLSEDQIHRGKRCSTQRSARLSGPARCVGHRQNNPVQVSISDLRCEGNAHPEPFGRRQTPCERQNRGEPAAGLAPRACIFRPSMHLQAESSCSVPSRHEPTETLAPRDTGPPRHWPTDLGSSLRTDPQFDHTFQRLS